MLAGYFGGHLQSVPDERVATELQRLAELDDVGLLVLVDALGSARARRGRVGCRDSGPAAGSWQTLPRDQSSRHVACLARGLARPCDRWPAARRSAASDLALRILDWPVDGRQANRAAVIADCEHVLRLQGTGVEAVGDATDAVTRDTIARADGPSRRSDSPSAQVDLTATAMSGRRPADRGSRIFRPCPRP